MKDQIKLSIKQIKAGINKWKSYVAQKDNAALISLFQQAGNTFFYTKPAYASGCTKLHLYPAVHNNVLYFFVIPDTYDKPEYATSFNEYVECCPVTESLLGDDHEISSLVAQERINRWANNYTTWIPRQNTTAVGMFRAFNMDYTDVIAPQGRITLGLTLMPDPDKADLIVTNYVREGIKYEDYTSPVPPFGSTAEAASFYLL